MRLCSYHRPYVKTSAGQDFFISPKEFITLVLELCKMENQNKNSLDSLVKDIYRPPVETSEQKEKDKEVLIEYFLQFSSAFTAFALSFLAGYTLLHQEHDRSFWDNASKAFTLALVHPAIVTIIGKTTPEKAISNSRYVFPATLLGLYLGQYCRNRF